MQRTQLNKKELVPNTQHVWLETILGVWVADLQACINNKVKAQRTQGKMYLTWYYF